MVLRNLLAPPEYCHYAAGPCDQDLTSPEDRSVFFIYPSSPAGIAETIQTVAANPSQHWSSWRSLAVEGKLVFCEICKALRHSSVIVADVTTLNFNLMFEIGVALGLGLPVIPIRDLSYSRDRAEFEHLGLLDTVGYVDFANADELTRKLQEALPAAKSLPTGKLRVQLDAPLYFIKSAINPEGEVQVLSTIKKAALHYATVPSIPLKLRG